MRYLNSQQLLTNLQLGKSVEQWLGYEKRVDYTILKWLRIDKEKSGEYSVTYFKMFDEGDEDFLDIYEFHTVDADEPYGIITTFKNVKDTLAFSTEKYKCKDDKYVNAGVIQEEYNDYLKAKKQELPPSRS